jgi:4-oxalocrotonate tautomerase
MPFVNIKVTREGVTRDQKEELIAAATSMLESILNKDPLTTHVVNDEIDPDNRGFGGETTTN